MGGISTRFLTPVYHPDPGPSVRRSEIPSNTQPYSVSTPTASPSFYTQAPSYSTQKPQAPSYPTHYPQAAIPTHYPQAPTPTHYPTATSSIPTITPIKSDLPDIPTGPQLSHLSFHGHCTLAVPPQYAGRIRTGWSSFRTKNRQLLWGEECWDLSHHTHLRLVVGYRGWEGWRNKWYCNVQTDGPIV
jgi:hypothetical protein